MHYVQIALLLVAELLKYILTFDPCKIFAPYYAYVILHC